jgi:hypothetical protein
MGFIKILGRNSSRMPLFDIATVCRINDAVIMAASLKSTPHTNAAGLPAQEY